MCLLLPYYKEVCVLIVPVNTPRYLRNLTIITQKAFSVVSLAIKMCGKRCDQNNMANIESYQ